MPNSHDSQPHCLKGIDEIPLDKRKNICTHIDYTIHCQHGYWDKLIKELEFNENDSKNFQLAFAKHQSPTENLLRECSYRNYRICTLSRAMKTVGLVKLAAENLDNIEPMKPSLSDSVFNDFHKPTRTPTESDSSSSSHSCSDSDKIGGLDTFHFSYEEIRKGTENFAPAVKLGAGAFGKVYKVKLKNTIFACKVLTMDTENTHFSVVSKHREHSDLRNELRYLAEYRHPNIIPLYGWSLDGKDPCLIYQYMKNGSLQDCLQRLKGNVSLRWPKRARVACDAATGLQFLHTMKEKPLIHGDIKTANILLDESFVAKLGDFGLAREGPRSHVTGSYIKLGDEHTPGTIGYLAMEYMRSKKLSVQVDTYAFGVVLLELYTGRRAFDRSQHKAGVLLRDYMDDVASGENKDGVGGADDQLYHLQDPEIEKLPKSIALKFVNLALECCHQKRNKRPPMLETLTRLQNIYDEIKEHVKSSPDATKEAPMMKSPNMNTQDPRRHFFSRGSPVESIAPTVETSSSLPHKDNNIYSPPGEELAVRDFEQLQLNPHGRHGHFAGSEHHFRNHVPVRSPVNAYTDYPVTPENVFLSHPGQSPYLLYPPVRNPLQHIPGPSMMSPMGQRIAAPQFMPPVADPTSHMSPVFQMWPANSPQYNYQYQPNGYPQPGYHQYQYDRNALKLPTRSQEGFDNLEPKANPTATTPVSPGTPWTPPEPFSSMELNEPPLGAMQRSNNTPHHGNAENERNMPNNTGGYRTGIPGGYMVGTGQPTYQFAPVDARHVLSNGVERHHTEEPPPPKESPKHSTIVNPMKEKMIRNIEEGCEDYSQIFNFKPSPRSSPSRYSDV